MARAVFGVEGLQAVLDVLSDAGHDVFGPAVRDGAIVPGPVRSTEDLPRGVGDEQAPAHYRLPERRDAAFFGFAAPATSWKPLLFPSRRPLWRFDGDGTPVATEPDRTRRAFVGVRSCDLHGILVQDRVLATRPFTDPDYADRRGNAFIVAVACGSPAQTCFCASMGTGPAPDAGFDLALTEVVDADGHRFVADTGTEPTRGRRYSPAFPPTRPPRPTSMPPGAWSTARSRACSAPSTPRTFATCSATTSSTRAGTTSPAAASPAPTARWSARRASA